MNTKKMLSEIRDESGWTFIETLIVISIILILTSTVGFTAAGYIDKAKAAAVKTQISTLSMALDSYFMDNGCYPTEEQGIKALWEKPVLEPVPLKWDGPYLAGKITNDSWGGEYSYRVPGTNGLPFSLISYGKDRAPGGTGADRDINSWEE